MITSYKDYKAYFSMLGLAHPSLALQGDGSGFVFYDADRKLNRQRTETNYPVLEVERPSLQMNIIKGGDHYKLYQAGFSVLEGCAVDDIAKQEEVMQKLEIVVDQLIERLKVDDMIEGESLQSLPVRNYELDNLWGWTIEFTIKVEADYCLVPSEWKASETWQPIWNQFETDLSLTLEGQTHTVQWTSSTDVESSLQALRDLINADVAITATTHHPGGDLFIIVSENPGEMLDISSGSGHDWTIVRAWP